MNPVSRLFGSSLGKKYLMAISGCLLFLFVVAHLIGNLQVFLGADTINAYGAFLRSVPELLWFARFGLLALVVIHVISAIRLSLENKAARPVQYEAQDNGTASYASRTMVMSGLIVMAFIVYHLLHFTVQAAPINLVEVDFSALHDETGRHDVYGMIVAGFSNVWVSLFYVIAIGLLCLHLSHGLTAMFQSLGWKRKEPYGKFIDAAAPIISFLLFVGYISIPVAVLIGLLKTDA